MPFEEVFGTETTEERRPSLARKATTGHLLPFSPSAQTANTVIKTVTCIECDKPRVIATRLNINEQILLDMILDIYQYSNPIRYDTRHLSVFLWIKI